MALFAMALRASVASDTWWHLRAGSWMLENGEILRHDPFSLTRQGQPWIYPGWLAQIGMAWTYEKLGYAGLNLLTALCVLAAFWFAWKVADGPPLLKAFAFVLAGAVSGAYWSARPQILSFAMTGAFAWALSRLRRDGRRALWLLPALMALWVNLHGGFFIGLLLLGIEFISQLLDRIAPERVQIPAERSGSLLLPIVGAALCLLAISLNPNGPQMLLYPWKTVSIGVLQDHIQEWQSPNFHRMEAQPFLWMVLLTLLFMALSPHRPTWRETLTVALFGFMGFMAARNVALFGLLAVPVLSHHAATSFQQWVPSFGERSPVASRALRRLNVVLLSLVGVAAVVKGLAPLSQTVNEQAVRRIAPVAAADFLAASHPPGPLLNTYNWGSYLIWRLYPQYQSFVDGRTDLFGDEILEQYLQLWRADPGWERLMERWGIRLAMLEPKSPLTFALYQAGWRTLYQDDQAIVLAAPR